MHHAQTTTEFRGHYDIQPTDGLQKDTVRYNMKSLNMMQHESFNMCKKATEGSFSNKQTATDLSVDRSNVRPSGDDIRWPT